MAAKSVLQYVQSCLNSMDSDAVDGIAETEESNQVALLLSDIYYELMEREDWNFLRGPIALTASGDTSFPTRFTFSGSIREIDKLWYNVDTASGLERRELIWCPPEEFLNGVADGVASSIRQAITDSSNLQYYVYNNRMPRLYTTFDDSSIVCDAFDSSVESTLQASKVSAIGVSIPSFSVTDEFVPDIPQSMVPLLQHTLNAAAHLLYKQQQSPVDEARSARLLSQARRREAVVSPDPGATYYHNRYGRR